MVIDWLFARPCCRIDDSSSRIGVYAVVAGTSRLTVRRKRTQTMTISVTSVSDVTSDLVEAMNRLLPELSSSASQLSAKDLHEIVESPATVLFVARSDIQTIVGTLTLVFFRLPTGMRAWIEDVIVGPDARGLGVGAALRSSIRMRVLMNHRYDYLCWACARCGSRFVAAHGQKRFLCRGHSPCRRFRP